MKKSLGYVVISLFWLTACGGSSDDESGAPDISPPPVTPEGLTRCDQQVELETVTTDSAIRFYLERDYAVGKPGSIAAKLNNQNVSDYQFTWSQTAGQPLTLTTVKSPILAFTASQAGSYSFSLSVTNNNVTSTESITINVDASQTAQLPVRVDHQSSEGSAVSFRIDSSDSSVPSDINWCIASGPALNVDISSPEQALFTAPNINEDTISILTASAIINGTAVTDNVQLLITNEPDISSPYFEQRLANTFAYQANSAYADVLQDCVYSNQLQQSCAISQLPLIGQASEVNTQAILDRVLVSHQWMGENFEYFLKNLDPNSDFATLLESVTAVVISYDVRPSFYWVVTGAIYLDPNDLWLLAAERDTIIEAPDFRSGFGNDLDFLMPWRYVKNNSYTSYTTPRSIRTDRTPQQMMPDLASLLYHELAHANDFFPRSSHSSLIGPTLLDDYQRRSSASELVSDQLVNFEPLTSQ
ncbi:hypothetical protein TUM4438_42660 [Shewanella sairae]|uniref:PKD domain-containing protein n=1 Tax=Shewanella sairae TaxID=190310 RepID=A0ABQ4PQZ8_9GAMM|nr:hypothetical protein [Shewanella sairae]GIU51794.1 hypothetical protein TUM4438_42660 [Shewanella sairae]